MLRYLAITAAIFAAAWVLSRAWGLWSALRVHGAWKRVAGRTGLDYRSAGLRSAPRLEGTFRDRSLLVRGIYGDSRGRKKNTRLELRLASSPPVRLRIRREGPMALLGDLARAGFDPEKVDASDAVQLEGDTTVIRNLLAGQLTALLRSMDEWMLEIGEDLVAVERPGLVSSGERLEGDMELLADIADRLER